MTLRMRIGLLLLAIPACEMAEPDTSVAVAPITLDTATGVGFVGKGAVQSTFGWNNAELQANAAGISFSFEGNAVYEQSCVHLTGSEHKVVQKTFKKTLDLSSAVDFMARRNPQAKITGFNLTGITATTATAPTDLCNPGNSEPDSVWTPDPQGAYPQVTQTSSTTGTLFVSYQGESHPIWTDTEE